MEFLISILVIVYVLSVVAGVAGICYDGSIQDEKYGLIMLFLAFVPVLNTYVLATAVFQHIVQHQNKLLEEADQDGKH